MRNRTQIGLDAAEGLLRVVQERLREFGITLDQHPAVTDGDGGVDSLVALSRGDAMAVYSAQIKTPMTLTSLALGKRTGVRPQLLIGGHVSPRSANALREANIQFIDALGNAFISFDGVFIDTRGRVDTSGRGRARSSRGDTRKSTNLFSRGRAQVILALLAWPELTGAPHREIATAAGTSLGLTHDALTRLEEAGFVLAVSRELTRFDELLDLWTAAYSTGLGPRLEVAQLHGDPSQPLKSETPAYLSGEVAEGVDIARPATLTVYLDSLDPKLVIANRWTTDPERVRNISVRHKFWISPRPAEEEPGTKIQNAPWPLVYADLMSAGEARLAEVAKTWRADHARSD